MMLILASASPARKALLAAAGLRFESRPAHIDERAEEAALLGTSPEEVALHLASAKAAAVSRSMPDALVIGADQTLWFDDERLHKPGNHDDAPRSA